MKANWVHAALVAASFIVLLVFFGFILSVVYKVSESRHPEDAIPQLEENPPIRRKMPWDSDDYGPTGVEYKHTPQEIAAFQRNRTVIHDHSWLGGEIVNITHMPSEMNYYEREWYCQFCGVHCLGETLDYASRDLFFSWSV